MSVPGANRGSSARAPGAGGGASRLPGSAGTARPRAPGAGPAGSVPHLCARRLEPGNRVWLAVEVLDILVRQQACTKREQCVKEGGRCPSAQAPCFRPKPAQLERAGEEQSRAMHCCGWAATQRRGVCAAVTTHPGRHRAAGAHSGASRGLWGCAGAAVAVPQACTCGWWESAAKHGGQRKATFCSC